jgi:hypothetical protein
VSLSPVQVDASLRTLERVWLRLRFEVENSVSVVRASTARRIRRIRYPAQLGQITSRPHPSAVRALSTALHCVQNRVDEEEECFCFVCTHPPAPLSLAKPALATNAKAAPRARRAHAGGSLSELAQELTSVTPPHLLLR